MKMKGKNMSNCEVMDNSIEKEKKKYLRAYKAEEWKVLPIDEMYGMMCKLNELGDKIAENVKKKEEVIGVRLNQNTYDSLNFYGKEIFYFIDDKYRDGVVEFVYSKD